MQDLSSGELKPISPEQVGRIMNQTQSLGDQLAALQQVKDEVIPERANQGPIFSVGEVVHIKGGRFQITRIEPGHLRLKSLPKGEK